MINNEKDNEIVERKPVKVKNYYEKSVEFQILELHSKDMFEDGVFETNMFLFGVTKKSHSVCLNVKGFKPFFYVKIKKNEKKVFLNILKSKMGNNSEQLNEYKSGFVNKKIFYGFRGDETELLYELRFDTFRSFYSARKILNQPVKIGQTLKKFKLYEESVNTDLKFIHDYGIKTCGWVSFDINLSEMMFDESRCQINYSTHINNVKILDDKSIAPFLQMSYDIETYSNDENKFPVATEADNAVIQIGMTFRKYGEENYKQIILTLKKCNEIKNALVYSFENESDLILHFSKIIREYDPDIIYSYNGYRFDDNYINTRAVLLDIEKKFMDCSKLINNPGKIIEKNFTSSAYGSSDWNYFEFIGRINNDLFIYCSREFKLDSYKMDNVAKNFLSSKKSGEFISSEENKIYLKNNSRFKVGQLVTISDVLDRQELGKIISKGITEEGKHYIITEKNNLDSFEEDADIEVSVQKDPVGHKTIFRYYKDGDPEKIKIIAEYCLQDTLIPLLLVEKLNIFVNQMQMANVTHVPYRFILVKGQQIKVFSQILKHTKEDNYVIPSVDIEKENFTGATVLEPKKGAYFTPVAVLDFSSLYPSIMIAHNLCYSTIVIDEKYDNLEGYEYATIEWEGHRYRYVINNKGIIPKLLEYVLNERKNIKKLMKNEKDDFNYMVLDGFQLALKVSSNSVYGFFTANMLPCYALGSSVTSIGRKMINDTKSYVDNNYGEFFETIYGDSVIGETPLVLLDNNNKIVVKYIKDIECVWRKYGDKLMGDCDYKIMSGDGWTKIKKVIRHKTNKRIYKVKTRKGVVFVTEDHSLMSNNQDIIKPSECKIGQTKLWHNE